MGREEFLMLTAENRRLPLDAGAQPWIDKFPATNVSQIYSKRQQHPLEHKGYESDACEMITASKFSFF